MQDLCQVVDIGLCTTFCLVAMLDYAAMLLVWCNFMETAILQGNGAPRLNMLLNACLPLIESAKTLQIVILMHGMACLTRLIAQSCCPVSVRCHDASTVLPTCLLFKQ